MPLRWHETLAFPLAPLPQKMLAPIAPTWRPGVNKKPQQSAKG
jgi:hypothetical protein